MDISIVIPTKNRFQYIFKLINYYDNINFKGTLIIIDSSDDDNLNKTINLINSKKKININHIKFVGNEMAAKAKACSQINTKYVVQAGDDDYYCQRGLKELIGFLDNHQEYVSASGYGYTVGYDLKENKVKGSSRYKLFWSKKNTPIERMKELSNCFNEPVADYTVCRTGVFKNILKNILIDDKKINIFMLREYWEQTFRIYIFLQGKSCHINTFFLVRFRLKEPGASLVMNPSIIYKKDKKLFFKYYYYLMRRIHSTLKDFDIYEKDTLILIRNMMKKKHLNFIEKQISYLPKIKKIKKDFFNRTRALYLRIKNRRNEIEILTDKNSSQYNEEFLKIIQGILK